MLPVSCLFEIVRPSWPNETGLQVLVAAEVVTAGGARFSNVLWQVMGRETKQAKSNKRAGSGGRVLRKAIGGLATHVRHGAAPAARKRTFCLSTVMGGLSFMGFRAGALMRGCLRPGLRQISHGSCFPFTAQLIGEHIGKESG